MGRHGGGSRSGGSSRSSSRSGSGTRSGGSSTRTSSKPFSGCYNRTYVNKRGRTIHYYTSDRDFGKSSGFNIGVLIPLIFVTIHMLVMVIAFGSSMITFGSKVNGDVDRIYIEDRVNLLSDEEEQKTISLFRKIYDKSGMPITLVVDSFGWKKFYNNIEVYSEELYYQIGYDEDAMIILFTVDTEAVGPADWEYDMYCGDDTTKCFSDACFDKLLSNFHKGMASQNLYKALEHGWSSVLDDLAKTKLNIEGLILLPIMLLIYGVFYWGILSGVKKNNDAYKYFKEHPTELSDRPMTIYSVCPACGAQNSEGKETCTYCNALLKITDGNVTYVRK